MALTPRGLYAIADRGVIDADHFANAIKQALAGGAVMLQYRDKGADTDRRRDEAATLVAACRHFGARSIINDDPALAAAVGADGVHLGADDAAAAAARRQLGPNAVIGVSCYDDIERARAAAAAGADYVAFGRMYPSATKPGGPLADPALLVRARRETGLAVCAIGGLTVERAPAIIDAGADLIAVVDDLFSRADIAARAREYAELFA